MKIALLKYPDESDWAGVMQRAKITVWKKGDCKEPSDDWKRRILAARHSPIRYLHFSFLIEEIPSNVATHFARHVHAQPYISSLRNDRQQMTDGDRAPRSTPVNMILDMNAEELMVMANKRLCMQASETTRKVMQGMCNAVIEAAPEFKPVLVPMCQYHGGVCHEMNPCGRCVRG